jgi:hypothetical protein
MSLLTDGLKHDANGALTDALRQTHLGQAHFVDLRSRHRCEECVFWVAIPGKLRGHRCAKAHQLAGRPRPPVPAYARACKYFVAARA